MVAAFAAASAAKTALDKLWTVGTGKKPPANPENPETELREAVIWSAATGMAVALARMLAQRRAASYYQRSTGHLPAELRAGAKKSPAAE
jgi:hypothetical protein